MPAATIGTAGLVFGLTAEAGIGLVPEDRHSQAMIPKMSVKNNISVALLKRFTRLSWLLPKAEEDIYATM